jgi:hypothetical protein
VGTRTTDVYRVKGQPTNTLNNLHTKHLFAVAEPAAARNKPYSPK